MQSNVEDPSTLERHLNFSISTEEIQRMVDVRLKKVAKTTKIRGFRPGKVPLKIVAQRYGEEVRQDVLNDILKKNFSEAVQAQDLRIVGYPRFEEKKPEDTNVDGEVVFSASFEVYPEIKLGDLGPVSIERPMVEVEVGDANKTLEILRKQRAQYESVDRPVALGDRVDINYNGRIDGVEFEGGSADNVSVTIGEGKFLKDFEAAIVGMDKGQNKSFEVTFPESYQGKELAGKLVTFEVKLSNIEEPVLPELDAEFAKSLGIMDGNIQKMRDGIKQNLEWEVAKRVKAKLKDQAMQALFEKAEFAVPNILINEEVERLIQDTRQNFEKNGMKFVDAMLQPELYRDRAEKRIKLGLAMSELVKEHKLKTEPEQVRKIVEDSAQNYENPDEVIKWHYASPERLREAESMALEDSVLFWVLQQVEVVDKTVTFDEIMGIS